MEQTKMINLTIDGVPVSVPEGTSILEAARQANINIPVLCDYPDLSRRAVCRLCVVECNGAKKLKAACANEVWEGVSVVTDNPRIRQIRRTILEMILADHPKDCLSCIRNGSCELQALAERFGIRENAFQAEISTESALVHSGALVRDMSKCVKCGRCVTACREIQSVWAITSAERSVKYTISTPYNQMLGDGPCVYCGRCASVCPVGAIYENDQTDAIFDVMADPERHVIVQTAPAVRVALGDDFGLPAGAISTGKMVSALKRLGFARVFDTNFAADLTIMEEGHEFLDRLKNNGKLPMITSCCPGWINFAETFFPDLLDNLSSCKSPQQMFGAVAKTYYSEKTGIPKDKITVVSIMPCTAKKFECNRAEMNDSGEKDVDFVLTTRELARMIRMAGIVFDELPEDNFDSIMGDSTGAAVIFGASGGVMEAALRTVYEVVVGSEPPSLDFEVTRGYHGVKEATVELPGQAVKVAIVNSLSNAHKLMQAVQRGETDVHFIEVMACPGGCAGGGGQPYGDSARTKERIKGLYVADKNLPIRKSHENPEIKILYKDFLGEPLGERSHHLLHTHYTGRKKGV